MQKVRDFVDITFQYGPKCTQLFDFREALDRGVYTDQSLRDRFFRVEKMAKRTALVENEESSLLLYLLSYILSFLRVETSIEKVSVLQRRKTLCVSRMQALH